LIVLASPKVFTSSTICFQRVQIESSDTWGRLVPDAPLQFSSAKIGATLRELQPGSTGFKALTLTEMIHHPVEIVRAVRSPNGSIVRVTAAGKFDKCNAWWLTWNVGRGRFQVIQSRWCGGRKWSSSSLREVHITPGKCCPRNVLTNYWRTSEFVHARPCAMH